MTQDRGVAITRLNLGHPDWPALVAHIEQVEQTRWAGLNDLSPDRHYLAAFVSSEVAGHISLLEGDIVVPAADAAASPIALALAGRTVRETYVETFAVEERFRRQGIGRALQLAALDLTRDLGCYQMHSWSTLDKVENYALKLALGFAAHPAVYTSRDGRQFSGVYFVKVVGNPDPKNETPTN